MRKKITSLVAVTAVTLGVAACGSSDPTQHQQNQVNEHAKKQKAYLPHNDVELRNYNDAQKLYDSPSSILWCTAYPTNPSAPLITVPVAGKLTSSSTTFFPPEREVHVGGDGANPLGVARSVDGLFHPNPPQYRYGFTPGGQYVDFFNIETICTTALTKNQRQTTKLDVSNDASALQATAKAERLLAAGDKAGAQKALETLGR